VAGQLSLLSARPKDLHLAVQHEKLFGSVMNRLCLFGRSGLSAIVWGALGPLLLALAAACATSPSPRPTFETRACAGELSAAGARCGIVQVPENYTDRDGRSLALNVIVLPARTDNGAHDAQFDLDGGPGFAATDIAGFYLQFGAAYLQTRDIVIVDQRGTGGSNPLRCPEIEAHEAADAWAPLYPPELVARCAAELSARADLSQYTTANSARDLDQVRAALGHERISIFALSYGTTLAQSYIALHPERVRAAVLMGVAPAEAMPPRLHAQAAEGGLRGVLGACAADPACRDAFPDPEADFATARETLGGERGEIFAEWLRTQMYAPAAARTLPRTLGRAAAGDFSALEAAPIGPQRVFADGLYLSITCAESFARFDVDAAREAARETAFGDYRLRRQQAACAHWPVTPQTPPEPPAGAQTPILMLSGEFDPATPSQWADAAIQGFANARHVIVPGSGHVIDGMSGVDTCFDPLVLAFLDSADPASLDTTCINEMRAPAFATE